MAELYQEHIVEDGPRAVELWGAATPGRAIMRIYADVTNPNTNREQIIVQYVEIDTTQMPYRSVDYFLQMQGLPDITGSVPSATVQRFPSGTGFYNYRIDNREYTFWLR